MDNHHAAEHRNRNCLYGHFVDPQLLFKKGFYAHHGGKMTLFIIFIAWSGLCVWAGYKTGEDIKLAQTRMNINSLSFRQAAKWIFIHEQRRHQQDIDGIEKDLKALEDVELPEDVKTLAGKIRFEV